MSTTYTAAPAFSESASQYGNLPMAPKKESVFSVIVVAIIVILIIMVIYSASKKERIFPDSYCKLDGFLDLQEADAYIRDPEASSDVQMTRCIIYALLSDQCQAKCDSILVKAKQLALAFKTSNLAKNVDELERYLLLVWNDCVKSTMFPASLSAHLLNFQSYRQRLQPPYIDATLADLRSMMYVRLSFSPFFIDCGRAHLAPKRYFNTGTSTDVLCRKSCGVEPNYPTNMWSLNKFASLSEADAYVNDPAVSDHCRLIRAAMLVPVANIGHYTNGNDAKALVEAAIMAEGAYGLGNTGDLSNSSSTVASGYQRDDGRTKIDNQELKNVNQGLVNSNAQKISPIRTVEDLENYLLGAARTMGFDSDMTTLRMLMYTTEFGNPARASNGDAWFKSISCLPAFRDKEWAQEMTPDCKNLSNSLEPTPWVVETNARERFENPHNGNRFASERSSVV